MTLNIQKLVFNGKRILLKVMTSGILAYGAVFAAILPQISAAEPTASTPKQLDLAAIQGNALMAVSNPAPVKVKTLGMLITAYSSTPDQTDSTPFITASGTKVKDGIVANNLLPFGTKIKIPDLYGDKVFTVEDRMHSRKSGYQVDIWLPEKSQAVNFGVKKAFIEVISN